MMGSLNKIGFIGSYKCDLLQYLSRVFTTAGKRVLVIDCTDEQLLPYSIPNDFDNEITTYYNYDACFNCKDLETYNQIDLKDYDVILIDFGFNHNMATLMSECDEIIMVTDIEKHNILKLNGYLQESIEYLPTTGRKESSESKEQYRLSRIYRDIVKSKVNLEYLDNLLNIDESVKIERDHLFYFDEVDYRIRIESQYNDSFEFKKLSKDYRIMFLDILKSYMDIDEKELKKMIKLAGKVK